LFIFPATLEEKESKGEQSSDSAVEKSDYIRLEKVLRQRERLRGEEIEKAQHEKMHENTRVDATEVVGDEDFRIWQVRSLVPALTFGVGFYQSYCVLTAWWFSSSHEDKKAESIVFGVADALTAHLLQAYGRDIV